MIPNFMRITYKLKFVIQETIEKHATVKTAVMRE